MPVEDLTGKEFGDWKVRYRCAWNTKDGGTVWFCDCKCGISRPVSAHSLRSGASAGCGHSSLRFPADLTGLDFTRLHVVGPTTQPPDRRKIKSTWWLCKCSCGSMIVESRWSLTRGHKKSCGCLQPEMAAATFTTHGMSRTGTYWSYRSMMDRCFNFNTKAFKDYGGRGITVCARWCEGFENFLVDMGERPPKMSLDRFPDHDGNYEKSNCRWATAKQQAECKRHQRTLVDAAWTPVDQWLMRTGFMATSLGVVPIPNFSGTGLQAAGQ